MSHLLSVTITNISLHAYTHVYITYCIYSIQQNIKNGNNCFVSNYKLNVALHLYYNRYLFLKYNRNNVRGEQEEKKFFCVFIDI